MTSIQFRCIHCNDVPTYIFNNSEQVRRHISNHKQIPECLKNFIEMGQYYFHCSLCGIDDTFEPRNFRTFDAIICHIFLEHLQERLQGTCCFTRTWLDRHPSCSWCGTYSFGATHADVERNNAKHLLECKYNQYLLRECLYSIGYHFCDEHNFATTDEHKFENHLRMHYLTEYDFSSSYDDVFGMSDGSFSCKRCLCHVYNEEMAEYHLEQHKYVPLCLRVMITYKENSVVCKKCDAQFSGSIELIQHIKRMHMMELISESPFCASSNYKIVQQFFEKQDRLHAILYGYYLSEHSPIASIDVHILKTIIGLVVLEYI